MTGQTDYMGRPLSFDEWTMVSHYFDKTLSFPRDIIDSIKAYEEANPGKIHYQIKTRSEWNRGAHSVLVATHEQEHGGTILHSWGHGVKPIDEQDSFAHILETVEKRQAAKLSHATRGNVLFVSILVGMAALFASLYFCFTYLQSTLKSGPLEGGLAISFLVVFGAYIASGITYWIGSYLQVPAALKRDPLLELIKMLRTRKPSRGIEEVLT